MDQKHDRILGAVARYYSEKLSEFGQTPQGVDWNGVEGQFRRFVQLMKVVPEKPSISINDLGCGYGALIEYLSDQSMVVDYLGTDLSADMISAAAKRYQQVPKIRFEVGSQPSRIADFSVASGIFNVKQDVSDKDWLRLIEDTIGTLNSSSALGFSFNCLTSYSDQDKKRDYLYYADPLYLFDLCKKRFSRDVALLHDYGLYEFTILVRKSV